ncbi:D-alanyl-D-alanine carboxypeptidase [Chelativorans sp. AA-79]|nr:D-alanyl-D-alanine carboxypeptidase family protein [Chelativorans sp. AA-79]WEX11992.1 D-alanyl-D-alanine carboxypeptidase [Chelativorans sp. AA-79]
MLLSVLVVGAPSAATANAKYAGVVVDAKTGRTLYADHADALRYPASLTKMMTLYLTFDALKSGRISKSTRIPVSRNAAAEVPTKLGLKPGQTITVEQAILSLVTKSANDAATALGEFLGGSEAGFARMMTARARDVGMNSTTFKNAHGLPNSAQKTTARDMARLGMALRDHHPEYYDYFRTRSFTYKGRTYGNHNRLLGRVKGVDGIKTGYIRASGFNLVSSVETGGRSIVAVVVGGRSGRSRNAHMIDLIGRYLPKASTGPDRFVIDRPGTGALVASVRLPKVDAPVPSGRPSVETVTAYAAGDGTGANNDAVATAIARPKAPVKAVAAIDRIATGSTNSEGWVIQIASMPSKVQAREILERTAQKAPALLGDSSAFTERFTMEGQIYHRARYAGFETKTDAWDTCRALKEKSISCYAVPHDPNQQS